MMKRLCCLSHNSGYDTFMDQLDWGEESGGGNQEKMTLNYQRDNVRTFPNINGFENCEKGNWTESFTVNRLLLRKIVNIGVEAVVVLTEVYVCL